MTWKEWQKYQSWVRNRRKDYSQVTPNGWVDWTKFEHDRKVIEAIKRHNLLWERQPLWYKRLNRNQGIPPTVVEDKPDPQDS